MLEGARSTAQFLIPEDCDFGKLVIQKRLADLGVMLLELDKATLLKLSAFAMLLACAPNS